MSTILTRAGKGSALTHNEMDTNWKVGAQAKSALYNIAESDNRDTIECDGTFTTNLPDAATIITSADTGDFEVVLKNIGTGVITVGRTTGADTIDAAAADVTLAAKESGIFKVNTAGDGYNIIAGKSVGDFVPTTDFTSGTVTFTNVTATTDGTPQDIAHGLGTDDLDFNFTIGEDSGAASSPGLVGLSLIGASCISAGGRIIQKGANIPTDPNLTAHAPAAGNIRFNIRNNSGGSTNSIKLYWWARKR